MNKISTFISVLWILLSKPVDCLCGKDKARKSQNGSKKAKDKVCPPCPPCKMAGLKMPQISAIVEGFDGRNRKDRDREYVKNKKSLWLSPTGVVRKFNFQYYLVLDM